MERTHGKASRDVKTRLALRTSIFGGSLSTRDEIQFSGKSDWRDVIDRIPVYPRPAPRKKRSFKDIVAEAMAAGPAGLAGPAAPSDQQGVRRPLAELEANRRLNRNPVHDVASREPRKHNAQKHNAQKQHRVQSSKEPVKPSKATRPQMKGTFYGNNQPVPALAPVRHMPSYSDQTDLSDLIDDGSVSDDGEWASEFVEYLGSYAEKDFSAVDRQRNNKMQATGEEIFEAERRTLKIAKDIDHQERQKQRIEKALEGRKRKRQHQRERMVVID